MTAPLVQAVNELLRRHGDAQAENVIESPWLVLGWSDAFGDEHWFAIWKTTGAIHTLENPPNGPVSDEPIWEPT